MLLSSGNKFFSGEGNLINIELISIKKFRQNIEKLYLIVFEVLKFLEISGTRVCAVDNRNGAGNFAVGNGVVRQVVGR
jgi:hypothetical protein